MSDWFHALPLPWMALVVFGFTYALSAAIYAGVAALATGQRAKSFKAMSQSMLPVLGIIFGLFVAFMPEQIAPEKVVDVLAILGRQPALVHQDLRQGQLFIRGPEAASAGELLGIDQARLKSEHAEKKIAIGRHGGISGLFGL